MEEMDETPTGKQCYFVTQEDFDESRTIRTTVVVMTGVFCDSDDLGKYIILTKPARSDITRFFAGLSAKISRALNRTPKDIRIGL